MTTIKINSHPTKKEYKVKEAVTESEKAKGLQGIDSLPKNEGMLFIFSPPQDVSFWMKDVKIPLDIIFINEDEQVIQVVEGKPNTTTPIEETNVAYVLEVNKDSGVQIGDEIEFPEDKGPVMKVLNPDGSSQYELWGGERIFSRKHTRVLMRKAEKAEESQTDRDFKALGNYMFKCLNIQNNQEPEYVEKPKSIN